MVLGILSICNSYSSWVDIFESSRRDGMFSFRPIFFVPCDRMLRSNGCYAGLTNRIAGSP